MKGRVKDALIVCSLVVSVFQVLLSFRLFPDRSLSDANLDFAMISARVKENENPSSTSLRRKTPRSRKEIVETITREDKGFAACLILMDDNHFLIEWLAYHYHSLPLRRLIVGHDPKSKTSPKEILDRYRDRGLMNITEWNDADYGFDPFTDMRVLSQVIQEDRKRKNEVHSIYIMRQQWFYASCMKQLKSENYSWTAIIDTDEYILPNDHAKESLRLREKKPTVLEMLNSPENRAISPSMLSPCIQMNRLNIGVKEEENRTAATHMLPDGFNHTDFFTFRWRWHDERRRKLAGKSMIDLSRVNATEIDPAKTNPHAPLSKTCSMDDIFIRNAYSTFVAHQYIGTYEQYTYRDDARNKRTPAFHKSHEFEYGTDDGARFWLQEFVDEHGKDLATDLLRGAGHIVTPIEGS